MRQALHRRRQLSFAVPQSITRGFGHALARRWLSLKNTSLPVPTDPPQRILELSQARRVSIMDAGSGRLGDVLCVVRLCDKCAQPARTMFRPGWGVGANVCLSVRQQTALLTGVSTRAQHGCPGSGFDFRYLGGELERAGMRVIRVDLPGNNRTPLQVFRAHVCLVFALQLRSSAPHLTPTRLAGNRGHGRSCGWAGTGCSGH